MCPERTGHLGEAWPEGTETVVMATWGAEAVATGGP